jgi:hypothetical protein
VPAWEQKWKRRLRVEKLERMREQIADGSLVITRASDEQIAEWAAERAKREPPKRKRERRPSPTPRVSVAGKTCTTLGCVRPMMAREKCKLHYTRAYRDGTLQKLRR